MVLSSVQQLATDTSFIAVVKMNKKVTNTLFSKMRLLGSDKARAEQSSRILQLINGGKKQVSTSALSQEFGFADEQEFKNSIFVLFKRKMELNQRYSNYQNIAKDFERKAYDIVSLKLESNATDTPASFVDVVCVECHFNNCSECCSDCVQTPMPEEGGGGSDGSTCRSACNNIRISSRNVAEIEVIGEFSIACPGVSWGAAEIGLCLGPQGAAVGGVCAYLGCGALAYLRYLNNISIAENNYAICQIGCK